MRSAPKLLLVALLGSGCSEPAMTASSASAAPADAPHASAAAASALAAKEERHTSKYADAMQRMQSRPIGERRQFAAAAVAELTKGRLLEPLRDGFQQVGQVEPRMGRLVLMKALAAPEVANAWTAVCAAGPSALAEMAKLKPDEQARHLWSRCELRGLGLIDEADALRTDGVSLAAAMTAASQLGKAEDERALLAFFLRASPAAGD